jgi:tRNA pseudouridine55 synthase
MTSFGVVSALRRLIGQKSIGHAGTLDRAATGLLVVCTGTMTRLSRYLIDKDKRYIGTITLGVVTDSCDGEGTVVEKKAADFVTREMILRVLDSFLGEILQRPPEYSALKINGMRASDRMRKGESIEMKERQVTIRSIDLLSFDPENMTVTIDVACSKGTYIRSLARDIGEKLGCGGFLSGLVRTRSGDLRLEDALTLEELKGVLEGAETNRRFLLSAGDVLTGMGRIVVNDLGVKKVHNGAVFGRELTLSVEQSGTSRYTIWSEGKNLIAIADVDIDNWLIIYLNVFK